MKKEYRKPSSKSTHVEYGALIGKERRVRVSFSLSEMKFCFNSIDGVEVFEPVKVSDIRCEGVDIAVRFIHANHRSLVVVDPLTTGEHK